MSKSIVVAEDFNVSRKIIVSTLAKEGFNVMEAVDGREAADLFDGRTIDLLITDFNMPTMNGAELIKKVRSIEAYSYMPILLLTTEVRQEKIQQALDGNITAFIKKPFDTQDFVKIVKKSPSVMTDFTQEFIEEAKQVLKNLEESLLRLEQCSTDIEEVNTVYRHLHTLKGGAGMFGFHDVERLSHELESVYSDIRDGVRQPDDFILDLTLHAADVLSDLLDGKDVVRDADKIIKDLAKLSQSASASAAMAAPIKNDSTTAYVIFLTPDKHIFKRGINLPAILDDVSELGANEIIIHGETVPFEQQLTNKEIESWFEIILVSNAGGESVRDVFMFMKGTEYDILEITGTNIFSAEAYSKHIQLDKAEIDRRIAIIEGIHPGILDTTEQIVTEATAVKAPDAVSFDEKEEELDQEIRVIKKAKKNGHVSVATQKLDQLIDIVSELVIFRSELHHLMGATKNREVGEALEKLERLSLRLRDSAFGIRLVPLNILNVKLQRLIRSVSKELGKEIEFITDGLDTELDRSMINALEAPLMHIIRNAIDHGIEKPEERERLNKPRKGLLKFYSYNSGDHVFIQLQDDGNGIDFDKIRAKAIEKGLMTKTQTYSEKDLINIMMTPGFSTASEITTVSGRGVGMDVVKKEIAAIRGDIEVSTEKGLGSIFTLRLPLTLTVLDTLVVKVEDNKYLLPISEVQFCYEEEHAKLFSKKARQINYEGQLMPFVSLREHFGMEEFKEKKKETVIVINKNDTKIAVVVDGILGKLQTVYKPLNELLHPIDCFSGASILGDGSMALILNALKLKS